MRKGKKDRGPIGSSFEDFLREQGLYEEAREAAVKSVLAWQISEEMKRQKLSKAAMARKLGTSPTEIYRVLDPRNHAVSLATLMKAAAVLGKRLHLELVDAG
ncbi:MAG TPA: XRE family transcriptional regulator [Stellaceae bacterium]|nr:XRE family transcriptional regulator [Stellaceae bacterium]